MSSPAPRYLTADQAARRRAQAPAGSGKTELLILPAFCRVAELARPVEDGVAGEPARE